MKVTRKKLRQIINEEIFYLLHEDSAESRPVPAGEPTVLPLKELPIDQLDTALKSLGDTHADIVDKYIDADIGGSLGMAKAWIDAGQDPTKVKWEDWISVHSGHYKENVRLLGGLDDDNYTISANVVA